MIWHFSSISSHFNCISSSQAPRRCTGCNNVCIMHNAQCTMHNAQCTMHMYYICLWIALSWHSRVHVFYGVQYRGDIPKHWVLTQHWRFSSKTRVFLINHSLMVEYLIDLWCGPLRARFDENTSVGLKTHMFRNVPSV